MSFSRFQESQGTQCTFLAESTERAYNERVAGEWGSGLTDLATESLIDVVAYHLVPMYRVIRPMDAVGPADTVPGGHPEDDTENCDPSDHDSKSERLWMGADGSLLRHPVSGGGGSSAVGDGQGAHLRQDGPVPDSRRGRVSRDRGC